MEMQNPEMAAHLDKKKGEVSHFLILKLSTSLQKSKECVLA